MLQIKTQSCAVSIDLIYGKYLDLEVQLYSDNIEDILELQRQFAEGKPKEFFKYLAENIR